MAKQTGLNELLKKLKEQFDVFREEVTSLAGNRGERPAKPPAESLFEQTEVYLGPPLEIGNELLVTQELVNIYRNLANALGRVVIVDQILTSEAETIKASAFGIQVHVKLNVAQHMRSAYLQREQTSMSG